MATKQGRVVLMAGATGLVGREILNLLLADKTVGSVHCLGRRAPDIQHAKLSFLAVDFSALPALPKADECFIALGTTIKVAGSQAAFRAIDLDAVGKLALAAKRAGVTKVGVVSAMGANTQSRVFYNRIKGEME
ncbi:MAG: nucleoside-diphosphate sugar epimerase, partial [Burkholderiales bacterium PBB4]